MMAVRLILASQEIHDPHRQQLMKKRARRIADGLRKQKGILGVLLSGSVARGPVSEPSDLDIHVIISDKFTRALPEWTFHRNGIIENLHTVHEEELLRGWRARNNPASLSLWFHKTILGDLLESFLPLWWNPYTKWQERVPVLVSLRQNPDIQQGVARHYAESAHTYLQQARNACDDGASYDSHHRLRMTFQAAFNAALVYRGWMLRGSKKCIEIGKAFLPDALIEHLLAVGFDIVGLNGMTLKRASKLCKARLRYRTTLLRELRRLKALSGGDGYAASKLEAATKDHEKHNAMAYDYYSSLLSQNIILGPINHMRCFSGLSQVPRQLISCLYPEESPWPMLEFVQSDLVSRAVRDEWLAIMALTSSRQRCMKLSTALRKTLDNLVLQIG